jgi:hypothetical protein
VRAAVAVIGRGFAGHGRTGLLRAQRMRVVRELSASVPVKAPSGFALAFLNTYVRDRAGVDGDTCLPLRYTLTHLAGITLERDVAVRVEYVLQGEDIPATLDIAWEPDASLFPSFKGALRADATGKADCTLIIEGQYDAPGGVAGQLFDAVIGVRIANATLFELLEQFRVAIEDDYKKRMEFD